MVDRTMEKNRVGEYFRKTAAPFWQSGYVLYSTSGKFRFETSIFKPFYPISE